MLVLCLLACLLARLPSGAKLANGCSLGQDSALQSLQAALAAAEADKDNLNVSSDCARRDCGAGMAAGWAGCGAGRAAGLAGWAGWP